MSKWKRNIYISTSVGNDLKFQLRSGETEICFLTSLNLKDPTVSGTQARRFGCDLWVGGMLCSFSPSIKAISQSWKSVSGGKQIALIYNMQLSCLIFTSTTDMTSINSHL